VLCRRPFTRRRESGLRAAFQPSAQANVATRVGSGPGQCRRVGVAGSFDKIVNN
jgi:hypothetical protein